MRLSILVLVALLALPVLAAAQVQTFRREVRQIMGSAQSLDDARAAAIAKAKRDALEEAGTWFESLSEVKSYALAKDDVTALASGIVQTRVIEEQRFVAGDTFGIRVVAEVRVDNAGLAERIRAFLADRQRLAEANANTKREKQLLEQLSALERRIAVMENITEAEKAALRGDVQTNTRQLTARDWYDKGHALGDGQGGYTDPEQAASNYSEAIRLDSTFVEAYNNRGVVYLHHGQPERAIQDFDQALRLDPNYAQAYGNRGSAYDELKQHERAIQDHGQAIRLGLNAAAVYSNRGISYNNMRQYERAIADFDQAIRLDPNNLIPYRNRGNAHQGRGQPAQAYRDWRKACQLGDQATCDWLLQNPE
ncbi:MAG: tetratricopeptide repeat protein [Candidatus Lambdaproteobacteria bacterium]|nr:tetratricopeptide repeat protein [Candidatus Lambdaproteobacteria bacterium]